MTSSLARRDVDGLLARVCTVPTLKWSVIGDERLFKKDIRKILREFELKLLIPGVFKFSRSYFLS